VNASADQYLDLQLDKQKLEIVALDGMPLAYHDPKHRQRLWSTRWFHRQGAWKRLSPARMRARTLRFEPYV